MRKPLYEEGQRVKWIHGDLLGTITRVGDHRRHGGGIIYDVSWDDGRTSGETTESFDFTATMVLASEGSAPPEEGR